MHDYRITFTAVAPHELAADAAAGLRRALDEMPGPFDIGEITQVADVGRVSAAFTIKVRHAMADAARDGSRLAKEALKSADLPEAQLVELGVVLSADSYENRFW